MRTENPTAELLTADQVAAIFQVHRATVSRWGTEGLIPTVKVGSVVRYRRGDVERLIDGETKAAS